MTRKQKVNRAWYLRNRERISAHRKTRYYARTSKEIKEAREYQKAWRHEQGPGYRKAQSKVFRERVKAEVFAAYGDRCVCCGEDEPKFLTIDHVNNDGAVDRKKYGRGPHLMRLSLRRRKFPRGYQLLCFNCNCGKRDNGGVCPHKRHT